MNALLTTRIKAIAALVAGGVVSYVATAIVNGAVWTVHGIEVAAATAVLAALAVHQAPANKKPRAKKDAGHVDLLAVLVVVLIVVVLLLAVGAFR